MQTNSQKLVIFLFYYLPACYKKDDILPLTTALIAHNRSQFNHVFPLLISMLGYKSISFYYNRRKIKLLIEKKLQNFLALGAVPSDPLAFGGVGRCPQTS